MTQAIISKNRMNGTPAQPPPVPSKAEQEGWQIVDEPCEYHRLPLSSLQIDHVSNGGYQREGQEINLGRISRIAANWSWQACGAISVSRRWDGTFWVTDGQHRVLAARERGDIDLMPCMVQASVSRASESTGFLALNKERGGLKTYSAFMAALVGQDELAVAVNELVESTGYKIAPNAGPKTKFSVSCIAAISTGVNVDPVLATKVWRLCCDMCCGDTVVNQLFSGLFACERALIRRNDPNSLFAPHNRKSLTAAGNTKILSAMAKASEYKSGGQKAWAQGVLDVLNFKRKSRRIDPIC